MKTKTYLIVSIALLTGMSAWAQKLVTVSIYNDCSKNGKIEDIRSIGEEKGQTWVDLGLPSGIKWASCNVRATTPENYGNYNAWGENEILKSAYIWSTYKYINDANFKLTKYCTASKYGSYGFVDNKTTLDPEDDTAHSHLSWGGKWRMPTDAEWAELQENCTWTWTTQNGVNGYQVSSKTNSNSIFLPAAGMCDGGLRDAGSNGYYWSSSLVSQYPNNAWYLYFNSDGYGRRGELRSCGCSVRPVCP